jgi:cell division protein FtsL
MSMSAARAGRDASSPETRRAAPARARQPARPPAPAPHKSGLRVVDTAARRQARRVRRRVWLFGAITVACMVTAVAFHVMLAQGQLHMDQIDRQISAQQQQYQEARLQVDELSAPQRIIDRAKQLGFVEPSQPPTFLTVPGVPPAPEGPGARSTSIDDWRKVKPQLGAQP